MLTPVDIQEKVFSNSFRGYDATQVDAFLDQIISDYEVLYKDNGKMQEEINTCKDSLKNFESMEENIKNTLLLAEKMAAQVKNDANVNAKKMLSDAENKAKVLIDEAKTKATAIMSEAETKSAAIMNAAETKSAAIMSEAKQQAGKIINDAQRDTAASREAVEKIMADAHREAEAKIAEARGTASDMVSNAETKVAASQKTLMNLQQQIVVIYNNVKSVLNKQLQDLEDLIKLNGLSLTEPEAVPITKDDSDYIAYGE